ncbi:MAG TPA: hypothetical protein VK130_12050 [Steroidobacteraceae bacterium]|nr:hypothetical protein [Steroidobacteraceae bacterium]
MRFRLKAFALHLAGSATVITLVLGTLYLGWYRWPGWYLTGALSVAPIVAGVDVSLGPLITLLIASPRKPRRSLARDVSIIVAVQLAALAYGAATLWQGRPLYYAFSVDRLQLVQASDLNEQEIARARRENAAFAPYWYARPRWVWAPLPEDPELRAQIMHGAITGGDDVIQMPRLFRSWERGLPELRARLRTVDGQTDLRLRKPKPLLRQRVAQLGFDPDQPNTLLFTGHGTPLLAVVDGAGEIKGIVCADSNRFCLPRRSAL